MNGARSLTPAAATAAAIPAARLGVAFGPRFFVLLAASVVWAAAILVDTRFAYGLLLWDVLLLAVWLLDLWLIPPVASVSVRRTWLAPPALTEPSAVEITLINRSARAVRARLVDTVPGDLRADPPALEIAAGPEGESSVQYDIRPIARGVRTVGDVHVRLGTPWGFAERWARVALGQEIVVYPDLAEARRESIAVARWRQQEGRRRSQSKRGAGRVFESLREYQRGDEIRDICWTASARRTKLVTKTYAIEPSQSVWIVMDAGRLMRTRVQAERADLQPGPRSQVTKLDRAVNAALSLAQVAIDSGDRVGLMAYGRRIQTLVPTGRGRGQIRAFVERLARVGDEELEADHLQAAARLVAEQKRRALVVWITDVPDMASTPDVIKAASCLMPRHLVLFAVIGQPDLGRTAAQTPDSVETMFEAAAAQEVMHRRDLLLARLRGEGALAFEVTEGLSSRLINGYIDVKQRGRL